MAASDAHPPRQERESLSFEVKRLSWRVERQDGQAGDLRTIPRQGDSRIGMLRDQLGRSQAELESMSARFTEVAAAIPDDIGFLGERLSTILNAASAEAEEIRAEAHRFAEIIRANAEEDAAAILAEAQLEYQLAVKLRDDVEAQSEKVRADIAQVREQAAIDAAETLTEARSQADEVKSQAEDMLVGVQRQVDAQVAAARTKLDELNQVRARVVSQLERFYETFKALDRPGNEMDPVRAISLASTTPDLQAPQGVHSVREVDSAHQSLGDVG
ncbi:M protein [Mycolicibacterium sp. S2-37]|uniref:M protein n=1 Tax=Mycolicibacterium sp. S2-37 TaxID=2810297 RepID=UPI001A94FCA1|nr:M protein [Mycolicibacterium sp. S2-37]MBO0676046.1 M protein [Mycolicibacterium sp. S2-37]